MDTHAGRTAAPTGSTSTLGKSSCQSTTRHICVSAATGPQLFGKQRGKYVMCRPGLYRDISPRLGNCGCMHVDRAPREGCGLAWTVCLRMPSEMHTADLAAGQSRTRPRTGRNACDQIYLERIYNLFLDCCGSLCGWRAAAAVLPGHVCQRTCTADTVKYQCDMKMWPRDTRIRCSCVHTRLHQQPTARAESKTAAHVDR